MNFKKQLFDSLKRYLEGTIEREKLNEELGSLHSKIIETKRNTVDENSLYISVIYWISRAPSEYAYNDDEIKYVYNCLIGEEGYGLQYTYWIPNDKQELNDTEQRVFGIAQKYISNYENNAQHIVFDDQRSYLEEADIRFIRSLCSDKQTRQEFRKEAEKAHVAVYQLLKLLDNGQLFHDSSAYDTDRAVAEKLKQVLASYQNDLPAYCVVSLKNGCTTVTVI